MTKPTDDGGPFRLVAYEPLLDEGLALPCYARAAVPNTYYRALSYIPGDRESGVVAFEPYAPDRPLRLPEPLQREVSVGAAWCDVVLWDGDVFVGDAAEIWSQLASRQAEIAEASPLLLLDLCPQAAPERARLTRTALARVRRLHGAARAQSWRDNIYLRSGVLRLVRKHMGTDVRARDVLVEVDALGRLRVDLPPATSDDAPLDRLNAEIVAYAGAVLEAPCVRLTFGEPEPDELASQSPGVPPLPVFRDTGEVLRRFPNREAVVVVRPHVLALAARTLTDTFPGVLAYPVEVNNLPWTLDILRANGIKRFWVRDALEGAYARAITPDAQLLLENLPEEPKDIRHAYEALGTRTFCIGNHEELERLTAVLADPELELLVKLRSNQPGVVSPRGWASDEAYVPSLLLAARRATQHQMGIALNIGPQQMRPSSYAAAMADAARQIVRAGVMVDIVDVGGGLPSVYPGGISPPLSDYIDAITRAFEEMPVHDETQLWCRPGRALVAESASLLLRMGSTAGEHFTLGDVAAGALRGLRPDPPLPVALHTRGELHAPSVALTALAFTERGVEVGLEGATDMKVLLARASVLEVGMVGAHLFRNGRDLRGVIPDVVGVEDAPMASKFGLAPHHYPGVHLAPPPPRQLSRRPKPNRKKRRRRRKS